MTAIRPRIRWAWLITLGALVGCDSNGPGDPDLGGRILFSSNPSGRFQIWSMEDDGEDAAPLFSWPLHAFRPSLAPDGRTLLFDNAATILAYDLEADTSYQVFLEPGEHVRARWSPQGGTIAFSTIDGNDSDVALVDADGTDFRRVAESPAYDGDATWSPDGGALAFVSARNGSFHLYTMTVAGERVARVLPDEDASVTHSTPSWSPDGQWIAYARIGDDADGIWVVRPSGRDARPVAAVIGASEPAWSPDSRTLVFVAPDTSGHTGLFSVRLTGGSIRALTAPHAHSLSPMWAR